MSDVLIVGGGVIGLLTARELERAGADVTLVEMGRTGREASWAGGGIISPLYPWRYGEALTALSLWSQREYPKLCAELLEETGIDPELVPSGLMILDPEEQDKALAWGRAHGESVELLPREEIGETEPNLGLQPSTAILMPKVANVRNPRFVRALRESLAPRVQLREQEEVVELLADEDRAIGVRTTRGRLIAERIIVCAGAWTAMPQPVRASDGHDAST